MSMLQMSPRRWMSGASCREEMEAFPSVYLRWIVTQYIMILDLRCFRRLYSLTLQESWLRHGTAIAAIAALRMFLTIYRVCLRIEI